MDGMQRLCLGKEVMQYTITTLIRNINHIRQHSTAHSHLRKASSQQLAAKTYIIWNWWILPLDITYLTVNEDVGIHCHMWQKSWGSRSRRMQSFRSESMCQVVGIMGCPLLPGNEKRCGRCPIGSD